MTAAPATTSAKPLADMTRKELLEVAKSMAVVGRYDMSKEELLEAVSAVGAEDESVDDELEDGDDESEDEDAPDFAVEPNMVLDPKAVKEAKARYPSLAKRGPDGKVIRKGVKFNLNTPFKEKLYILNPRAAKTAGYDQVISAAPPQVQKIVQFMKDSSMTSAEFAARGGAIVDAAKAAGAIVTKIDSASLFAYHRRTLERVGVVHVKSLDEE